MFEIQYQLKDDAPSVPALSLAAESVQLQGPYLMLPREGEYRSTFNWDSSGCWHLMDTSLQLKDLRLINPDPSQRFSLEVVLAGAVLAETTVSLNSALVLPPAPLGWPAQMIIEGPDSDKETINVLSDLGDWEASEENGWPSRVVGSILIRQAGEVPSLWDGAINARGRLSPLASRVAA